MSDKFTGFETPKQNWSRLPHALINSLHLITSESELKVILYILRHTWGYGDEQKKITIDEFCNGRKRRDGSRLDNGLGLSVNAVKSGIEKATEHGFVEVFEDATDKARIKRYYQLANSKSGGQSLTPWVSEVDPLLSEVDPRSEKETTSNILEKETSSYDEKLARIQTAYQNNITISVSPITVDEMKQPEYFTLPTEWWIEAIGIAAGTNKRNWRYVRGILDRSIASGLSPKQTGTPKPPNGQAEEPKPIFAFIDKRTGQAL